MSELISGKEALIALTNGEVVECKNDVTGMDWCNADGLLVKSFFDPTHMWEFRLKPRTVNLNGVEVPAPFETKLNDGFYYLNGAHAEGFSWRKMHDDTPPWFFENPVWRTEDEIKQVVAALRSVFGKK